MAEFYGRVQGNRGEATRMGSKHSGIYATAETWGSVLRVEQRTDGRWEDERTGSEHLSFFALTDKNGWGSGPLRLCFDADLIARHGEDPRVKDAAKNVERAFEFLDRAALAAEADAERSRKEQAA